MGNLDIYNKVRAVPKEALKQIIGGRLKGFSDINPMWRIKTLTETFGVCGIGWKVEIVNKWLEHSPDNTVSAFMDINLYVKVDGEWSEAIPGTGGSSFISKEKNGFYASDECYKMAYTDALSVACKMIGVAADVYYEKDRTKYDLQPNSTPSNGASTPPGKKSLTKEALSSEKLMEWIYKREKSSKDLGKRFSMLSLVESVYLVTEEESKELIKNYEQYKINKNLA